MTSKVSIAQKRRKAAERNRAYWARKRLAAAPTAAMAPATAPEGDPVLSYCRKVLDWAALERTPAAGRFAAMAADIIERHEIVIDDKRALWMAEHGLTKPSAVALGLSQQIASENLTRAIEEMAAGRADAASVRAGLRSAGTLTRRQSKVSQAEFAEAFNSWRWSAVSKPPAHVMIDPGSPGEAFYRSIGQDPATVAEGDPLLDDDDELYEPKDFEDAPEAVRQQRGSRR